MFLLVPSSMMINALNQFFYEMTNLIPLLYTEQTEYNAMIKALNQFFYEMTNLIPLLYTERIENSAVP